MSPICPADGHFIRPPFGDFCQDHGVRWFVQCVACPAPWPLVPSGHYARTALSHSDSEDRLTGADFCANCGIPGPWLTRDKLIQWIRHQLQADTTMPGATRLELLATMDRLQAMSPDDTKAIAGWEQIKKGAPKVWEVTKPVRDVLISEAVKKALGL